MMVMTSIKTNEHAELLRWVRMELNILCEMTTEDDGLQSVERDPDFGAYARGRMEETLRIKREFGEIIRKELTKYPAWTSGSIS